ncbi:putative F-box associated interaction domain-containing protein [Medicago truncatula]|nr:putative F-box associated interaction domain-containing protein [Medicago truncatula]
MSKKRLIVSSVNDPDELLLWDSSISSVFSNVSNSTVTQTQLNCPISFNSLFRLLYGNNLEICSCHGILCFAIAGLYAFLWNPSLRRYNVLPPLENPEESDGSTSYVYSFGYDHFSNVYKVVAISHLHDTNKKNEVSVHSMGTGYWRRIHNFPYSRSMPRPGVFVSGTVNWLASDFSSSATFCDIVSLDLEKESYQQLSLPDFEKKSWTLGEYGIKESWTKLYTIRAMGNHDFDPYTKVVYISEDDQFLIDLYERTSSKMKLGVYDSKIGTLKFHMIQNINGWMGPEIYAESLISPCS